MRILIFCGMGNGGAERQMSQLADGLAQRGHEVVVVAFTPEGKYWHWLQARQSVRLVALFEPAKHVFEVALQLNWAAVRLRRLIQDENIEIVYSALPTPNAVARLATWRVKGVTLVWGQRASSLTVNWKQKIPFHLCIRLSSTVPLLISNSQAGLQACRTLGYRCQRFEVIPNGIDTARFQPSAEARAALRAEWGVTPEQTLIGIVARLSAMKDHPNFLRAAARLVKTRDDVRFVCVGTGPDSYRLELQALAQDLGLANHLTWAGERSDVPAVHSALDILTSSSSFGEGFSNAIGEAMACETPCVATDIGDAKWVIGDTGVVVEPHSPEALCRGWQAALDLPADERSALGVAGRERIKTHFSTAHLIDRSEQLLAEQVQRRIHALTGSSAEATEGKG